jgi:RimJ/RimL family protein N-acetyltransferase
MIATKEHQPVSLQSEIPVEAMGWRNNRAIWQWCRQNTLITVENQKGWLEKIHKDPTIKMFSVCAQGVHEARSVGVCGFTSIDMLRRSAEFSLYIAPEQQKNGYGWKALELLCMHGFMDWGFKRIWGEVFDGNPAMKMFERVGFQHEGTLRKSYWKNGHWLDSHMISMLDSDWVEKMKKRPHLVES